MAADQTTPLLLPQPNYKYSASPSSVDETVEYCIGSTGPRQLLQAILIVSAWVFDAQQTFINIFADSDPKWHCIHDDTSSSSCSSSLPTPCGLPAGSWEWAHPKRTSTLSDFGLECAGPIVVGLPASSYFAGCLAGGLLLATLADSRLGRKNMLFLSTLTMSIAALLTALSPNLWAYSALRFVCGFARATVGTSALVLSTEIVGRRWRDRISVVGFFFFTLGFLSLPGIAYLGRGASWRNLYLWTSIPSFVYSICVCFFTRESPRWLLVRGRREEAIDMLKKIAAANGNIVNSSFSTLTVVDEGWNIQLFSAVGVLWEKKWALRRLTAVMIVGFGVGMIYYGMPLNLGNLGPNLYVSVTLNALAELPSSLIIFFLVGRMNRRCSLLVLTTVSGVCSVLCAFLVDTVLLIAVEVVSFFCALTAFSVLLIYSIELFPTCVRNTAISMVRQALVLGGVFAPILVAAGRRRSFLSFGVFGLAIGCCGLFAAYLPETRGSTISDTLEEEEYKENVSNGSSAA